MMDWWTTYIEPIRESFRGYSFRDWWNVNCFSNRNSDQSVSKNIPELLEEGLEKPDIKSQHINHKYSNLDDKSITIFDYKCGQYLEKIEESKESSSHPAKIGNNFSDLRTKEKDIKKFK